MNCRELNIFKQVLGRMPMSPEQSRYKKYQGLKNKSINLEKYEELFENCVLKDRRLQRDDLYKK